VAGCYSTTLDQGCTFSRVITWKDSADDPVDLTGYSANMEVRSGSTTVLELDTTNGRITLAGTITLEVDAADTSSLSPANCEYDLVLTSPGGIVTKLLCGSIVIRDTLSA
jgi:hypothetical protein